MTPPRYSLVIPLYNEAGNLLPLLELAAPILSALPASHEIILVDDGSRDTTPAEISLAASRYSSLRSLTHAENLGQATSLLDGLHAARGEIILTMDADGQNDPRDFPLLLAPIESNVLDLACGWRIDRHDSPLRRALSRLGNLTRRLVLHDTLHDTGCQLRAFRREIISHLFPVDLLQSFIPSIAAARGFRVGEFPVRHHPRRHGRAHFGFRQLSWRPALALWKVRRQLRAR